MFALNDKRIKTKVITNDPLETMNVCILWEPLNFVLDQTANQRDNPTPAAAMETKARPRVDMLAALGDCMEAQGFVYILSMIAVLNLP